MTFLDNHTNLKAFFTHIAGSTLTKKSSNYATVGVITNYYKLLK